MLRRCRFIAAILLVPFVIGSGCVVTIDDNNGGGNSTASIRVRVVNATNTTLDPEIYRVATEVPVLELFNDGNKFTRFGVGTLGILGPGDSDEFDFECSGTAMLGTRGGRLGDDISNPTGVGRQIVLTRDLNIFCDSQVTFTFQPSGSGFTTTFDVSP
jgi:hypothetical protein